jgi:hypothetical protein
MLAPVFFLTRQVKCLLMVPPNSLTATQGHNTMPPAYQMQPRANDFLVD